MESGISGVIGKETRGIRRLFPAYGGSAVLRAIGFAIGSQWLETVGNYQASETDSGGISMYVLRQMRPDYRLLTTDYKTDSGGISMYVLRQTRPDH